MSGSGKDTTTSPAVSVIVPTYHRPQGLAAAVSSVLAQDVGGRPVEVIVVVSDPQAAKDVAAARALADSDPRVRVVLTERRGPGAARNAGIRQARASLLAFLDDDCVARPGWLAAGMRTAAVVDLVQGRTVAAGEAGPWDRFVANDRISWLWEACNLFVRREAIRVGGLFDEDFNPTRRVGRHFGEDVEWGWRLVRYGATFAYCSDAVVAHAVERRRFSEMLARRLELRWFPLLLRVAPELRRKFVAGVFLDRRHAVAAPGFALLALAPVAGWRARRAGLGLGALGLAIELGYWRRARTLSDLAATVRATPAKLLTELVEIAALGYGSVRYRRFLL